VFTRGPEHTGRRASSRANVALHVAIELVGQRLEVLVGRGLEQGARLLDGVCCAVRAERR
jgi:hypothetical protein